jgi:hypothetical protein
MEHAQLDSEEWSHIVMRLGGAEALALSAREYQLSCARVELEAHMICCGWP